MNIMSIILNGILFSFHPFKSTRSLKEAKSQISISILVSENTGTGPPNPHSDY
jgi:hypothetical protein